jgi:hypothetical protein
MADRMSTDDEIVEALSSDEELDGADYDADIDDFDDEEVEADDPEEALETEDLEEDDLGSDVLDALDADDLDDEDATIAVAADPGFDDEVVDAVAGDDELEGIRDAEFVCRSCHLAKRDTQLADAKAMLCRDCA